MSFCKAIYTTFVNTERNNGSSTNRLFEKINYIVQITKKKKKKKKTNKHHYLQKEIAEQSILDRIHLRTPVKNK